MVKKLSNYLVFILLLNNIIFAGDFIKEYISGSFSMYATSRDFSLQGGSVSLDRFSSICENPAAGFVDKFYLSIGYFNFFSSAFNVDNILLGYNVNKKMNMGFALKWVDFGEYYDTRSMIKDAVYQESSPITDTINYWSDELVQKRKASEVLFKTMVNRKIGENWKAGVSYNILFRTMEIDNYLGNSFDIGVLYSNHENLSLGLVVKNFGAALVKRLGYSENYYDLFTLAFSISYKTIFMNDDRKYIVFNISNNSLLSFNENIVISALIHFGKYLELFGSHSLAKYFGSDIDLPTTSFGLTFSPTKLSFSYAHAFNSEVGISHSITVDYKF